MKRLAFLSLVCAFFAAAPVMAQRVVARDTVLPGTIASDSAGASIVRGAAVILETPPNKVHVIAIDIPEELRGRDIKYSFVRLNTFGVMGRLEGSVAADADRRALGFTIAIPATAAAGRTTVGVMRFTCASVCETIEIPVVVDVLPSYALRVSVVRSLFGSHSGGRVRGEVTVRNDGNASEHVYLSLEVPNDWRSRIITPQPIRIDAGASATAEFDILIAESASEGDYGAVVRAASASGATGFTALSVRIEAGQRGIVGWRPSLETHAAFANDVHGHTAMAAGAELTGELMPDIRVNGRLSVLQENAASGLALQSLGRLGYSSGNSYLFLTAPHWETGIGNLGLSEAGLAGNGLWGFGATGSTSGDRWHSRVLGVRPVSGGDGHYVYAEASRLIGVVWAGVLASDMQDQLGFGRDARTLAGTLLLPWRNGSADVEAGYRSGAGAAGFGWLARAQHRTSEWSVNLRAANSPGGTAAFARAENELQIDAVRRFGNSLSFGASYWKNRDSSQTGLGQGMRTTGGSVSGQVRLGSAGQLSLASRTSELNQSTSLGTFHTVERGLEGAWVQSFGALNARLGASRGIVDRQSDFGGGLRLDVEATQTMLFANVSTTTARRGEWQVDVRHELTGAGVGVPTSQSTLSIHADRVPVLDGRATIHGDALFYYLAATRSSLSSQRVGVQFRIGDNYALVFDVDHSQFFGTGNVASPWAVTTKIQRAVGLPALRGAAPKGLVFADLNGDGNRQAGERGVPGVVVRADGNVVTTDAKGRFVTGRGRIASIDIDPRSLPTGWIVAPRADQPTAAGAFIELAVIPTSPVEITVRLGDTQGIDTANVHLNLAVVVLTDSLGRSWTGEPDRRGVLRLDALPPGLYEISADLSKVGETLMLPQPLPTIRVQGGTAPVKAELKLTPRPIRRTDPARIPPIKKVGGGAGAEGASPLDGN